jgi:hypothetical protein
MAVFSSEMLVSIYQTTRCYFCGSFYDAVSISEYRVSNGRIGEYRLGKDLEGSGLGLIEVSSRNFPVRTEENHGKPQLG